MKGFLDGVALSHLTPGPLAMLATFAGYKGAGFLGALAATVCIFLPGTVLMLDFMLLGAGFAVLQFTAIAPMAVILGAAVVGLVLHFS